MAWGTRHDKPDSLRSLSIPGLVKRIALEAPGKTACSRGGQNWSYGQLDAASLFLARLFHARGLSAGDEVPIFLSRCFDSVASILALMRLGVCFVPMDAESWSQGRVDAVLKAVQPKLVVYSTATELAALGISTIPAHVVRLTCEGAPGGTDIASIPDWVDADRSSDEPIYIIFTSGTTGQPKGVVIPRRCIENYVRQGSERQGMPFNLGVQRDDRVLLLFSLAFDAAWGVFFSTLCWGGELVLSQPDRVLEDAKTCTILPATPSLLLSLGDPQPYQKVRSIFLGGETPFPAQIQQWSAAGRRIYNCYGPSECSICVSMAELRPEAPIVLGEPMADTQLLILDEQGEVADEGELGITGPGLAIGYYQNPELTAERFVTWRGQRLYRTLDRVRRIPEGVVFCGRKDSMVKNRGFLINIDLDVLPALQSYPGIVSAAAFTRNSQLMAVVTPADVDTADMRHRLSEKYDSFVVPDQIHACSELPRTANGKVDMQALQSLVDQVSVTGDEKGNPQAQTSVVLLQNAVAAALRWPPASVPMDRSFWELGGNSLLAVRLLASLHENGYTLPFEDIFSREPLSAVSNKLDPYQLLEKVPEDTETTAPMTLTQLGMVRSSIRQPGASYMLVSIGFPWKTDQGYCNSVREAWTAVLARHAIFRTSFDLLGGVQKLAESSHLDWTETVVSTEDMDTAIEHASQCLWDSIQHGEASDVFVPVNALRLLVSKDNTEASLLWLVHHSLVDGWSIGTVIQEVQAVLQGESLPPQRLQFLDFSQRLPQHLENAHEKGAAFWKELLSNVVDASPLDLPKPDGLSTGFGQVRASLAPSLATIEQLCAVNKVTPAAVFHAAWALLLRSYMPQDHVVFGTVFSGRDFPLPGIHSIVGPTLNTCPFPVDMTNLSDKAAFLADVHTLLRLVSTQQWSAAGALQEHMPGSHARILQTVLFLEYDLPGFGGRGWHFDRTDRPEFGLTVSIRREGDQLSPRILFDRAEYTEPAVQRMASHLCHLVQALLDPRCLTVADVRDQMLDAGEFLELTGASSTLMEPYIGPSNLKMAFESGVDQWPDAVAVETRSRSVTYRELDQLANVVARRISSVAHPGESVAIVSDRSLEWIVAVMAVIKAGTVYVPLDTKLPLERMQIMLATSSAKLCLFSSRADRDRLGKEISHPSFCLPELLDHPGSRPETRERLAITTQPADAAYITFTSGSTGVPKGVCITHQSVVSYLAYGPARMDARPGRRHAQMFSPGFDVNQAEIFGTLCFGATLVLADPDDPFAHLSRVHATMITPSFLSVCAPDSFPDLDTILFAGEAVPQALADRWSAHRTVYNSYGPCECTIGCLFQPLQPHTEVTLGRTIPRVGVYILDEDGRPVPRGVPGEICLSGIQIAGRYIGAGMEAQSRRFVADPFVPGLCMYRTGDCAVWTEDMEPRFRGRFDNQIKIRGYRVELTEIENVIRLASPDVRRAAVVVQGDVLVAFVEPDTVHVPTIQARLHSVLPAYACPSQMVALPTLPTMPNQKLDRKKLQAYTVASTGTKVSPALSPMQQLVAEAWQAAIGLSADTAAQIDAASDFLVLGGSSLSQIKVAQIVCQRLDTKLPLKLFLWNTTLSALSDSIVEHRQQKDGCHASFQKSWKTVQSPFNAPSHLEREFILLTTSSPTPQAFNVAVHLQLAGEIDLAALEKAALAVMAREPILHSCFQLENGTVVRRHSASPCTVLREEQPVTDLDSFARQPFDLSTGPLSRLLLRQRGDLTSIVLVQHHAVTDKSAMQAFFRRLQSAYLQQTGSSVAESDRPPDYTVWAQWKARQGQPAGPILQGPSAEYWKIQLADLPSPLFQQPSASLYVGQSSSFSLEPNPAWPGSMELFVALVGTALANVQGAQDVVIGIPHVDRTEPGTEEMLGVFLDRLPIRFQVPSDRSAPLLPGLIQSVGGLIRDALSHSIPFQDIRGMAKGEDIFQVMVVYNRREDAVANSFSLPGITTEQASIKTTGAKFPLLVEFTETQTSTICELEYMENMVPPSVVAAFVQAVQDMWRENCPI